MRPKRPSAILDASGTPAFLVSNLVNIRFLTGLDMSSALLLLEPKTMTLFTDGRYIEVASRSVYRGISVKDGAAIDAAMKRVRICGIEDEGLSIERFHRWKAKFKNTKFVHTSGLIAEFRRSKDPEELAKFRRAQRITREMIRRVPSLLKCPIREIDLAWQLQVWARELGAEGLSFDPIVAFGTHTSSPHHKPTGRMLKQGHIVQIDCGAKYRGYCADQSAVFFTGKPTPIQSRVFTAICEAKDEAIAKLKPGVSVRDLDSIAREVLKSYGYEEFFCHALGHGVGLEIHEGSTLSKKAPDRKLLKGEIITIEPGVYFPGRFGMRVEEEIIVE
ncbi:MAG: Xaa-Pro aminopeptidase [Candidatus Peregrinibacteria bacterium Greene1014_49]|nr:MAG: Xaa-Pro aminopeptidase [Candidatus Peregrinibacteria bacterium Greene1014_49]